MSSFNPSCCCKGMERPSKYRLPIPENRTLRKIFQEISKLMSFWRLEGCGRGVRGVFVEKLAPNRSPAMIRLKNWLRFGALRVL